MFEVLMLIACTLSFIYYYAENKFLISTILLIISTAYFLKVLDIIKPYLS